MPMQYPLLENPTPPPLYILAQLYAEKPGTLDGSQLVLVLSAGACCNVMCMLMDLVANMTLFGGNTET
jgi:hypothetical protein